MTLALGATLFTMRQVGNTRRCLITTHAPRAMMSLQLAPSKRAARDILREWRNPKSGTCHRASLAAASENLERDRWLIASYSTLGVLLVLLAATLVPIPWLLVAATGLAAVLAGVADLVENRYLSRQLSVAHGFDLAALKPAVAWARAAAQAKFALLLVVGCVVGTSLLAAFRRRTLKRGSDADPQRESFADVVGREVNEIIKLSDRPGASGLHVVTPAHGEPRVDQLSPDLVGLALSGGGIRSATFNLGVLGGLAKLDGLRRVDYLTTVSGGGYVGSFWSAWLLRQGGSTLWPGAAPKTQSPAPPRVEPEPAALRHLREFSRFLAPRRGFFEAEMWQAVVALVSGLLPSFAAAGSLIGLGLVAWLVVNFCLACPSPWAGMVTVALLTVGVLAVFEWWWFSGSGLDAKDRSVSFTVNVASAIGATLLVASAHLVYARYAPRGYYQWEDGRWVGQLVAATYEGWWKLTGITHDPEQWFVSPRLFELAMAWIMAGFVLLCLRPLVALELRRKDAAAARRDPAAPKEPRHRRVGLPAYDRTLMRLLGAAVGWAAVAVLWHLSINLGLARKMAFSFLASAGAFAAMRNWMGVALRKGQDPGPLERIKAQLPQILAYVTIALMVGGVGSILIASAGDDWFAWYLATASMAGLIVIMLLLDPAATGLHTFYRERIVRAYSGAINPLATNDEWKNLQSNVRAGDDLPLASLPARPLHLVCCAANDLSGDQVETLDRGARSAVLSRNGVTVGGSSVAMPDLTLGEAITASAAAFNSNMGAVSTTLGPAVSFLMSALNLRLGLWVANPARPRDPARRLLPGYLFFREMFMQTSAGDAVDEVHLSDGGHFENLALYELIRRHCRYVIVSDCGEDPTVSFDDFGNAARRVREDFGVQIDIDLTALRPDAEHRSRQHVAVGVIHYTDFDKGVLLYVKPTLTGDEPQDVLQYACRNPRFPHEPTSDQFYNEAQWESYRTLGEHTACTVFGFIDRYRSRTDDPPPADWIFTTARQEWHPTPADLGQRVFEMTERFGAEEAKLQGMADATLLREIFPELPGTDRAASASTGGGGGDAANLVCLVRMVQLMEDVWSRCDLDTSWNHPLNLGWVNCFARWTSAPTFRMWWPLLRPMYGPAFQRFMEEHFAVLERDGSLAGSVTGPLQTMGSGLAERWWTDRHSPRPVLADHAGAVKSVYEYEIELRRPGQTYSVPMQVAVALVRHESTPVPHAWWTSDDFFVPPSLWGAGIGGAFLSALLTTLDATVERCDVYVRAPRNRNDPSSWTDRLRYVEFYKSVGFRIGTQGESLPDGEKCQAIRLERIRGENRPSAGTGASDDTVPHVRFGPSADASTGVSAEGTDGHPIT